MDRAHVPEYSNREIDGRCGVLTKDFMTANVVTVLPTTTVEESYGYMKEYRIRHLPVVDRHGDLVGIVSDRDVRLIWQATLGDCGHYSCSDA